MKKAFVVLVVLCAFLSGCAVSSNSLKKNDGVTIVLNDGTRIKARVLDITSTKVVFNANDWKKAYEYGEVLSLERIKGIKLADDTFLSLSEYKAFRKDASLAAKKERPGKSKNTGKIEKTEIGLKQQFTQLKNKPISEMTDNEFKFFMAMIEIEEMEEKTKQEERQARQEVQAKQARSVAVPMPSAPLKVPVKPVVRQATMKEITELAESVFNAGLAVQYLAYLDEKAKASEPVSQIEERISRIIRESPRWREHKEELAFLSRAAEKAMGRVYLYSPEELQNKLNLDFDADADMDFDALFGQLHRSLGEDVTMRDYRKLVDVFGESGGLAIKDALENYSDLMGVMAAK